MESLDSLFLSVGIERYFSRSQNLQLPYRRIQYNKQKKTMENLQRFLVFVLFVYIAFSGDVIYLNNGCKSFDQQGNCVLCSNRFYPDSSGICQPVNPNCYTYDKTNGDCLSCYTGFEPYQGACLPKQIVSAVYDSNCNTFKDGVCVKCSFGCFFNEEKRCVQGDPNCKTRQHGKCSACYPGYELKGNKCQREKTKKLDPFCNSFKNGKCVKCSFGYYFDEDDKCQKIPDECKNFRIKEGICHECYPGFQLNDKNECVVKVTEVTDIHCHKFKDEICQECSFGYFFNAQKQCIKAPDECKKYNINKLQCEQCYPGYKLNKDSVCEQESDEVYDPFCHKFDGSTCLKCSYGYFFNQARQCTQIPDECEKYDTKLFVCQSCYYGYELDDQNLCVPTPLSVSQQYCKQYKDKKCVQCAQLSFLNEFGLCEQVSPLCKTYNKENGHCTSCFPGYKENDQGECVEKEDDGTVALNCKKISGDVCEECAFRHVKNQKGECVGVNPLCKDYQQNGHCISCFLGFKEQKGSCVEDDQIINDPNCAEWKDGICATCAKGAYFDESGKCEAASDRCKTIDTSDGACLTCFPAFKLEEKACIEDEGFASQDPNCQSFLDGVCMSCSKGFYFDSQGACTKVSDLCESYNGKNGHCMSCYAGFRLQKQNGRCVEDEKQLSDIHCAEFNKQVCKKCSKGFFFDDNHKCKVVNPLCKNHNQNNGKCTGCFEGFKLAKGECEISDEQTASDVNCAEWKDKVCMKCADRAYFNNQGKCTLVSEKCKTFDEQTGDCESCYEGYKLNKEKGKCYRDKSVSACLESHHGKCQKCAFSYYLTDTKSCQPIDDQCAKFDHKKKQCEGCYPGYSLLNKKCQITEVDEELEIQNCFAYTQDGNCLQCFDRYFVKENTCEEVDVFCKTYDKKTGACKSCYSGLGFELSDGKCSN